MRVINLRSLWKKKGAAKSAKKTSGGLPEFIEPMKAKLADSPRKGDWIYELKFDGYRALALKGGSEARLLSRNEKDLGGKFPEVMKSIARLPVDDVILDGEIVALDDKGRSSFQLLQAFELGQERPPIFFYASSICSRLDGEDFLGFPLIERKAKLEQLIARSRGNHPLFFRFGRGMPKRFWNRRATLNLEGLIGKKKNSYYEKGQRSGAWIKLKPPAGAGICHRRIHRSGGRAEALRFTAHRVPREKRASIRGESRHNGI